MKLLTTDQTDSDKNRSEAERADRIRKLHDEETAIGRRVNQARENELKEKAMITEDLASFRAERDAEKRKLEREVDPLRSEVKELEARKAVALEPIQKDRAEADRRLAEAIDKEAKNAELELSLAKTHDELVDRTTALVEREERAVERDQDLSRREEKVNLEEQTSQTSAKRLSVKWSEFYQRVDETNADLAHREKDVENGRKANETFRLTLGEEEDRLRKKEIELRSNYEALEQAKIHLGIK